MKFFHLSVLAALISVSVSSLPPPPLESLYDSSDASVSWPPKEKGFGEDKTAWPGHGERLGKSWPRTKVPVLKEIPSNEDFFRDYVAKRSPVVMEKVLDEITDLGSRFFGINLRSESLSKSGRGALTSADVFYAGTMNRQKMSMRAVLLKHENRDDLGVGEKLPYARSYIGKELKTRLGIPSPLWCSSVLLEDKLRNTYHNVFAKGVSIPLRMRQENAHQLYCQIEGEKEFLLLNGAEDWPAWAEMDLPSDAHGKIGPFINLVALDYEITPEVKDIKEFSIAKLKAGQCLFVPEGWIHQISVLDGDNSIEIRWEPLENEASLSCEVTVSPTWTLGDMAWLDEGISKPKDKTTDRPRLALSLLANVVGKYMLDQSSKLDDAFSKKMQMDPSLTPNLPKWNSECDEVAADIFALLDTNGDGTLDAGDLEQGGLVATNPNAVANLAAALQDRHQDFAEIIFDMRTDLAAASGDATGPDSISAELMAEAAMIISRMEEAALKEEKEQKKMEEAKREEEHVKDEL